jgi:hypothetical protein
LIDQWTAPVYPQRMAALILILSVLNLIAGEFSVTRRRLTMSAHPVMVRIRWLALGGVAALLITGHAFSSNDWVTWALVLLLAIGVARTPVHSETRPKTTGETA